MITTLILDMDGTLVDTNYLHTEAWAGALADIGLTVPRASIHRQIGKGADQFLPVFVQDEEMAREADRRHAERYQELIHHSVPLPGAAALIASLRERGYSLWLATSGKRHEMERYLQQLGAVELMSSLVVAADVEHSKPAPDLFQVALERSGASPDEAVVVGDTVWDVESALRAKVRPVGVLTGGAFSRDELLQAGAVAVFDDCAAMLAAHFPDGL